jgi:hypothetical protein
MLLCNCKEKIKNFSTAFAIALMSARLEQTVCYTVGVSLCAVSLNTAFVSYNFLVSQIITIINILTRIAVKAAIVYINKKPAII